MRPAAAQAIASLERTDTIPEVNRTPRLLLSASIALWALLALAGLQPNPGCDLSGTRSASDLDRGDASFRAKRAFVWDNDTLVAETGLNFEDGITWRRLVLPGPSGLDDAPLVRVEANLQGGGSPDPHLYAVVRDELGSVIGVLDQAPAAGAPALRARVLYTPYGEAHLETGPEPLRLWFDPTLTAAGGQTQQIAPPEPPATESEAIPGGLRLTTTTRLDPASVTAGLGVERYDPASGSWVAVAASAVAAGPSASEETELDLVLLAGWPKGGQIRITLRPQLADGFGRAFQVPAGEDPAGVRVVVTVPASGSAPDLDRRWPLRFDSGYAAANSLGGAFPDGQTSLFQGLWTDPVTGIAYARARWYDARNASWLSEDPEQTLDSPNLYAYVAWQPQMARDPSGRSAWTAYRGAKEAIGSVFANARVQGTMQVLQGAMEIGVGVAASETGVGLLAVAHGSDTSAAGLVALISGEAQTTVTHQAARDVALLAGAGEGVAEQMGYWTDMAVGTAASIGAARAVAARAPPVVRGGGAAAAPKSAAELRNGPGIAFGGSELPVSPRSILRGTEGNAGLIPREIADKLAGRQFGSFKEFRQAFWQEVAASPYAAEFQRINIRNLARMRKGYAPLVRSSQMFRGQFKYILHHRMPISQGGAVYDLENLLISSPRYHAELLDAAFHAGW